MTKNAALPRSIKPASLRADFPLLKNNPDLVYLDSAATTQKPRVVLDIIRNFYENQNANPDRGLYALAYEATELHKNCRQTVANFLNADSEQVIFTSGATEGLNIVALSFAKKIKPGDEIIVSIFEHHSNLIPWQKLAESTGATLKVIYNFDKDLKKITKKTKIVAISSASNVLGLKFPVKRITKLAHEKGAEVVCDATQLVAHEKINLHKLDVDFLAFSGHKMYAPMGIGVLYIKNPQDFTPVFFGSGALAQDVARFEPGTRNLEGELGLKCAIGYIKNKKSNNVLAKKLYDILKNDQIFEVYGFPEIPIVAFNLKGAHPHDVATLLGEKQICLRAGHHCAEPLMKHLGLENGCLRASFGIHNTESDVEKLVSALKDVWEILK